MAISHNKMGGGVMTIVHDKMRIGMMPISINKMGGEATIIIII